MKYLFVLGRHVALSVAEVEAVIGKTGEVGGRFMLIDTTTPPLLARLGGTERIVEVLTEQDHPFNPEEIATALLPYAGENKITLGISGLPSHAAKSLGTGFKKWLAAEKKSVRFIVPLKKAWFLNAAQVLFNSLLTSQNMELVLVEMNGRFYAGKTVQIQDIQAYERRDTARPARDAKTGMLPPKLAQIMLNIATGPATALTIYDPFCGTGVVLQEGWLSGHYMIGSDSNSKMIAASRQNLQYLPQHFPTCANLPAPRIFKHDVQQEFPKDLRNKIDAIVTEPYLGRPLTTLPSPIQVATGQKELRSLYGEFFSHALAILKPGGVILFALPAWRQTAGRWVFFEESFLDEIERLGYVKKQLWPQRERAVYSRPDALVGRELTLWQKQ